MAGIKMPVTKERREQSHISDKFWWPGVYKEVDRAIKNCRHCQLYEGKEEKAPMVPMMVTTPYHESMGRDSCHRRNDPDEL